MERFAYGLLSVPVTVMVIGTGVVEHHAANLEPKTLNISSVLFVWVARETR